MAKRPILTNGTIVRASLADGQPGGMVRLPDKAERARFEAFLSGNPLIALSAGTAWQVWQAALSAQPSPATCKEGLQVHPSPGGQDALAAELLAHAEGLERMAADDRETGLSIEQAIEDGEGYTPDEATDIAAGLQHDAERGEETAVLLRKAASALAARQPVGEHGEGDEFLAGVCVALQCVTAQDSGVLWAEIVRAVGVDDLLQYAAFIEPEEWDLAGFSKYASTELHRRKPRSKASKQAKRPPAQAVDLPYSLDADPAGIRARVCDVIIGTLMVGAQGHTPPPAGHWVEPFWKAARADAVTQAVDMGQLPLGIRLVEIPRRNGLDPINVFVQDYELGRGRIVVTCYGQAWCGFWGAMGDRTVMQFVAACDADYVAGNMLSGRHEHVKKHERAYVGRIANEVIAEFCALIDSQAVGNG